MDLLLLEQCDRESRRLHMSEDEGRDRHEALAAMLDRLRSEEKPTNPTQKSTRDPDIPGSLLRDLIAVEPTELLARVAVPILLCQGEKDIQVSPTVDTVRLAEAAESLGYAHFHVRRFPDLDHLFKVEPGVSSPERYFTHRPIGDELIAALGDWFHQHLT